VSPPPPNPELSPNDKTKTAADAFLNWVRGTFEGTAGAAWQEFFDENVGKFMRNATIYWSGMTTHYIQNNIIRSTQTGSRSFIEDQVWPNLRLIPVAGNSDNLIGAAPISQRNPLSSKIYGWWQETPSSDIWLLVDSQSTDGKRLAWVIADGLDVEQNDLVDDSPPQGNRVADYDLLNPGRAFSDGDLCTLLGVLIEECGS
jgi:hypothetical protein